MHKVSELITLDEFIIERQASIEDATGELSGLLRDIGLACKIVNRDLRKAGLVDNILGEAEKTNVQGEEVKKLDEFANDILKQCLQNSGECAGVASEEEDDIVAFPSRKTAKYVVLFDPLDGSSNIDVNATVGTIFSIYKRKTESGDLCALEDFTQNGSELAAAGYVIYGSSTMLVYTTGNGVDGFTLEPSIGEFCLSHPNIKTPKNSNIYSVNQGYYKSFPKGVQAYLDYCTSTDGKKAGSLRYIGSMVADFHRNLIKGGLYMYPSTNMDVNGKLRVGYECNPMAFIQEQAGGLASNGFIRILDIDYVELHQRTPIYIGSEEMVKQVESYLQKHGV
ncbi:MAG: class 1 fructose-bisphosphatase [Chitinophagales bacterium]|nr:class 1 fructose-bisphosphatase [Chitinophagales bacterium]